VLDIRIFSPIIYIWYEDGELRPSLVRLNLNLTLPLQAHPGRLWKVPQGAERRWLE